MADGCSVVGSSVVNAVVTCSGLAGLSMADRRQYGPSSVTAISSSASHAWAAEAGRLPGALASSHATQSRTESGASGARSASGGGGWWTWA